MAYIWGFATGIRLRHYWDEDPVIIEECKVNNRIAVAHGLHEA